MSDIKQAIEGAIGYLNGHPEEGRYTDSEARAVLGEGLRCTIESPVGPPLATDMAESVGGANSAPSAGWLFRAALASCNATLIAMRAAQQGVTLERLEVVVDSESDDRGILGIDPSVPAGPYAIRVRVEVSAPGVDQATLREIIDWGVAHCPVCDAAKRPVEVSLDVRAG